MTMEQELRVGIIGCGVIAPSHIDSYHAVEGVRVSAICDLREDRMAAIQTRYPQRPFKRYQDVAQMLSEGNLDAVSICTDHASHEALLLAAIAAGKHVICEKALTLSNASLDRMLEHASKSQRVIAGIFQHRFDSVYDVLSALLAEGVLGNLLTASAWHQCFRSGQYYRNDAWRGTWEGEGGSLLINQSIHFLDILQWIAGGVSSVSAFTANRDHEGIIETEDTAAISLRFRNGALGTFVATSGSNCEWRYGMHLVGTQGDVELRDGKLFACSHKCEQTRARIETCLTELKAEAGVDGAKQYYGNGHPGQIRDFIDAIRTGRPPKVGLAAAAETVRLVLAAYQSAITGKVIAIC